MSRRSQGARLLERATLAVLRRPLPIIAILLVALALAITGLGRTTFDFSAVALFADDDQQVEDLERLYEHWGPDDREILVVAQTRLPTSTVLEPLAFEQLTRLRDVLRAHDAVAAVTSVIDLPHPSVHAGITPAPAARANARATSWSLAEHLEDSRAHNDGHSREFELLAWQRSVLEPAPWFVPGMLSADGRRALTFVSLSGDGDDLLELRQHVADINYLVRTTSAIGPLHFELAGIPAVRARSLDAMLLDQACLVPTALGLAVLLLALFFRSLRGVIVPLTAAVVPTVLLLGLMGWIGEPLGILNQVYTTLLPCLAMADAIHILCRYETLRPTVSDRHQAIAMAIGSSGRACLSTSLTTAFGFLSLLAAPMPILRNFGLLAAVGMLLAGSTVILVVPLLLAALPEVNQHRVRQPRWLSCVLQTAEHIATTYPRRVVAGFTLSASIALAASSHLVIDTRLGALLPVGDNTAAAQDLVDAELGGTLPLHLDFAASPGFFRQPDVIAELHRLENELAELEGVGSLMGPGHYVEILQSMMQPKEAAGIVLPETRRALVRLLVMGRQSGQRDSGHAVLSDDSTRARVVLRLSDRGGREHLALAGDIETRLEDSLERLRQLATHHGANSQSVDARITGIADLAYRGSETLTRDLVKSLLLAFLSVGLVMVWIAGSWKVAALSLVQNSLPLLAALGWMGILGWSLEPTTAVIFTLGLAIAVDDTIHVLSHYRENPEAGGGEAILKSGRALIVTSVILAGAFGTLALGSFPALRTFGLLGTVIVVSALAVDVLLVPAMLPARRTPRGIDAARASASERSTFAPFGTT